MPNQVQRRSDGIVISRDGKPVAALVDAELFARIRRLRERFDALTARVAESYAEVPADVGLAEIDAGGRPYTDSNCRLSSISAGTRLLKPSISMPTTLSFES